MLTQPLKLQDSVKFISGVINENNPQAQQRPLPMSSFDAIGQPKKRVSQPFIQSKQLLEQPAVAQRSNFWAALTNTQLKSLNSSAKDLLRSDFAIQ